MSAPDLPGEQRQLDEFLASGLEADRCEAYADSTGERCQRDALPGIPYCPDHKHLLVVGVDVEKPPEPAETRRLSGNSPTQTGTRY